MDDYRGAASAAAASHGRCRWLLIVAGANFVARQPRSTALRQPDARLHVGCTELGGRRHSDFR